MSHNTKGHYALRIATWCAVLPMVFGTICFLMWLTFQDVIFLMLGLFTIYAAAGLFCVGLIFIILHFILQPKNQGKYKPIIVFFTLLLNFPLAFLYLSIGEYNIERYNIYIHNESKYEAQNIQILFDKEELASLDKVTPQSFAKIKLHNSKEGSIYFSMVINNQIKHGIIYGYVTSGMGGIAHITISEDLAVSVTESTGTTTHQSDFFGIKE